MVVVILVFLETIHLSWYDFKFLFINIYLTVSVKRVTREIRIRLRFSDVSSTTTYRIVTVLSIVWKCATSRANCLTSYGRILILRFLSDHLLIPEHLLHVMGCDTLTPKDIRLSNIQQATNSFMASGAPNIAAVGTIFLTSLVITRCQADIRTYHLPDDERMRYVLSHGRRVQEQLLEITVSN